MSWKLFIGPSGEYSEHENVPALAAFQQKEKRARMQSKNMAASNANFPVHVYSHVKSKIILILSCGIIHF